MCFIYRKFYHCLACDTLKYCKTKRELCRTREVNKDLFFNEVAEDDPVCNEEFYDKKFNHVSPDECAYCCRKHAEKERPRLEAEQKQRERAEREEKERQHALAGLSGAAADAA